MENKHLADVREAGIRKRRDFLSYRSHYTLCMCNIIIAAPRRRAQSEEHCQRVVLTRAQSEEDRTGQKRVRVRKESKTVRRVGGQQCERAGRAVVPHG